MARVYKCLIIFMAHSLHLPPSPHHQHLSSVLLDMSNRHSQSDEKKSYSDVESLSKERPTHYDAPVIDGVENLEAFAEYEGGHSKEGNLHRGIQSRQIGMIAVSLLRNVSGPSSCVHLLARRCCWYWSGHWIWHCARSRWSPRSFPRLCLRWVSPPPISLHINSAHNVQLVLYAI